MSVHIATYGYNVCKVTVPDALTVGTKTKVGIEADFNYIINMVSISGILLGECTLGGQKMIGAMLANPWANGDGIECYTISMAGAQTPYIVQLEVTLEEGEMYVTPSIVTLS